MDTRERVEFAMKTLSVGVSVLVVLGGIGLIGTYLERKREKEQKTKDR